MHPGTPHFVVTTQSCVAYGMHFYSLYALEGTLHAMIAEHFNGGGIVNTEHTQAPLLLLKGVDAVLQEVDLLLSEHRPVEGMNSVACALDVSSSI